MNDLTYFLTSIKRILLLGVVFILIGVTNTNTVSGDSGSAIVWCQQPCSGGCAVMGCDYAYCGVYNTSCLCFCTCAFIVEMEGEEATVTEYTHHNVCPG
jgi:hypothetical protein